jgi:aspartate/methionine/tyrosine aminotransferase
MKSLANAAVQMPRSGIRAILDLASTIPDAIHLEIGQPNFPTPDHICLAAYKATQQGFTGYTPNAGMLSLREAVAEKVRLENKLDVSADNIVITTGGMGGLFSCFAALLEPGDEVLVPDPGYPNYEMITYLCRASAIHYPLDIQNGFTPRFDVLARLVTPRTKAIMVNSPSNPTGAVMSGEVLKKLVTFANENDIAIISDECYEKITFDSPHISPASYDTDGRVLSIFSFSKTYSMTGWRVGYVVASREIIPIISKLQEVTVACASSVSQKAAEAALKGSQECVQMMVTAYRRRRDLAINILKSYGLHCFVPQGAFYLMVDISNCGLCSDEFAKKLVKEVKVAVAPGRTFGLLGDNFIRVSLASDDAVLEEGLNRVCKYITKNRRD